MIEVLRESAHFRNLWLAGLLSLFGKEVTRIGLFLYLFHEQASVANLALFIAIKTLSAVLAAPAAGFVVDRFNKRTVLVATDIVRAAFILVILWQPTVPVIFVMGALQSVATVVFDPAKAAAIPLILEPRQVPKANGVEQSTRNLVMVLGPVAGAELVMRGGLEAILVFDAVSYLTSAALVLRVRIPAVATESPAAKAAAPFSDIREGWRYFFRHRLASHMTMLFVVSMLTAGLWVPLAPFFIRDFLGASERLLGWQLGFFGVGGIAGGMFASWLSNRVNKGPILFGALLAEGVYLTVYSLVSDVVASCMILFVWGVAVATIHVSSRSILQVEVQERYLGRVFAVVYQGENVAMMTAMGIAVLVGSLYSSHLVFLAAGLFYVVLISASAMTRGGRALLVTP